MSRPTRPIARSAPVRALLPAVALVLVVGGMATASTSESGPSGPSARTAAGGVVTKAKVKKIARKEIAAAAPGLSVASARSATNVYAVQLANGRVAASVPGGASAHFADLGYALSFGRSHQGCVYSASPASPVPGGPQPGMVSVRPRGASTTELQVDIIDIGGAPAPFDVSVVMICPGA